MGCLAYTDKTRSVHILTAANGHSAPDETVRIIDAAMGTSISRHLKMGSGSYKDMPDFAKIADLGRIAGIIMGLSANKNESPLQDRLTNDQLDFLLNMIDAAGDMVVEMTPTIRELTMKSQGFSPDQKQQFIAIIQNTHTIQMANDGRVALPSAEIESLAIQTLDMMTDLFQDDILPTPLKGISLAVIEKIPTILFMPNLVNRLEIFQQETSNQARLEKDIKALQILLGELLSTDNLDKTTRVEIEDILQQLDIHEDNQPLDRSITKQLEKLSITLNEVHAPIANHFAVMITNIVHHNLLARADAFDMTPLQIQAIDSYMDRLEVLSNLLDEEDTLRPELKTLIAEAIISLDQNPASIKSIAHMQSLSTSLLETIQGIPQGTTKGTPIAPMIQTIINHGATITTVQTHILAKRESLPPAHIQKTAEIYQSLRELKKTAASLAEYVIDKQRIFQRQDANETHVTTPSSPSEVMITPAPQPAAAPPRPSEAKITPTPQPAAAPPRPSEAKITPTPQPAAAPPRPSEAKITPTPQPAAAPPRPSEAKITPTPQPAAAPPSPSEAKSTPTQFGVSPTAYKSATDVMAAQQAKINEQPVKNGISGTCNRSCAGCDGCSALANMMANLNADVKQKGAPNPTP